MKTRTSCTLFGIVLVLQLAWLFTPEPSTGAGTGSVIDHSKGIKFQRPPLRFEINEGQTDPQVRFTARDRDGIAYLTSDGAVFQISSAVGTPDSKPGFKKTSYSPRTRGFESSFVRMKTVGANPNPRAVGIDRLPGVTNYFIGNDPAKWRTNVAGYAKVKYESVYPGIDLVYYDNGEGSLEYDFIVAPGADPKQIALSIEDAQSVEVDSSGDLVISALTGTIRKPAPRVYQEIDGKRQEIVAGYRLIQADDSIGTRHSSLNTRMIAFALGAYDLNKPLVIDPQVIYATYLGGSSTSTVANEGARGVAVDAQGSVYIVGVTISTNFPTKNPAQKVLKGFSNAFITKLNATGQLVYSTYLGGSGFDEGAVIKVDDTGAAYVGGTTGSFDFPTVNPIQGAYGLRGDGFITKLSPSGSQIVYSTYLGGADIENVADLAIDAQKNVFVVGNISPALGVPANDFPTVNPIQATHGGGARDGFMSVINASGSSLLFSTYLGGDGDDFFQSIRRDPTNGRVYLAFHTNSSNFPPAVAPSTGLSEISQANAFASPGSFIFGLNPFSDVSEVFAGVVQIEDIIDPSEDDKTVLDLQIGAKIISGISRISVSGQSPKKSTHTVEAQVGGGLDARLDLLDENLITTKTTFFGGSGEDTLNTLTTDALGGIYVVGNTRSTDLPVVNPIQANRSGGSALFEGFLAVFAPKTLQPVFATYLGGTGMEFLNGVTVDPQGNIYVVGETFGNFPNPTSSAIQKQLSGRTDAFIIKISPVAIPLGSTPVDFDGDGKSDVAVFRGGAWLFHDFTTGAQNSGVWTGSSAGCIPVAMDYDGDGIADFTQFCNGAWHFYNGNGSYNKGIWTGGVAGDRPVPADYDGDGKDDVVVYRGGAWLFYNFTTGAFDAAKSRWTGGGGSCIPVPMDYDGDGTADFTQLCNGAWHFYNDNGSYNKGIWTGGVAGDLPVPADYDGDGTEDVVVFRGGAWLFYNFATGGFDSTKSMWTGAPPHFTGGTSLPAPLDYDGDGNADFTVYSGGPWHFFNSNGTYNKGIWTGGVVGDQPLSRRLLP